MTAPTPTPATPTPATATAAPPRPWAALIGYTLRSCVPPRRRFLLGLPCVGAVLFGLLAHVDPDQGEVEAFADIAGVTVFGLVIPLGCLIIGDAVLGAELRAGTFHFTWLSPVPFATIAVARWLGGWLVALVSLVPAAVLSAVVAGAPEAAGAMALATAAGSAGYIALFVLIGVIARRAAVWSLVFVFLVERLIGTPLSGIAQLSPMWLGRAVYAGLGPGADDLVRTGVPDGVGAIVRLAMLTAVLMALASWRLRRMRLAGTGD